LDAAGSPVISSAPSNQRCPIALGALADTTTTVTSKLKLGVGEAGGVWAIQRANRPERRTRRHQQRLERGVDRHGAAHVDSHAAKGEPPRLRHEPALERTRRTVPGNPPPPRSMSEIEIRPSIETMLTATIAVARIAASSLGDIRTSTRALP
jgi:hypothetical protein